jgi:hypothetical protein
VNLFSERMMSVLFTLAARVCLCRRRFARVVASMAASPLLAVDVEMVRRASATHALRLIWGRGRGRALGLDRVGCGLGR